MLAAPLAELTVLYDLATEVVHVLNPAAGLVWGACGAASDLDNVVAAVAEATDADALQVSADIAEYVAQLTEAGLVGRVGDVAAAARAPRPGVRGASVGAVHAVLDDGVRFRSHDPGLLAAIDELLGSPDEARRATIDLGVIEDRDGTVRVRGWGADERTFASREALLWSLPTTLNQIAAASTTCISLHAGAVRSPDGEVLLLPAVSGSGKTTLTAALVQAGWDYATDEAVGVRAGSLLAVAYPKPLGLDASSRSALGLVPKASPNTAPAELRADVRILCGDFGRVTRVVLPRFEPGGGTAVVELDARDAVVGLLEHALNLRSVGQPGLEALCDLALTVPVHRLAHGGVERAVAAIEAL